MEQIRETDVTFDGGRVLHAYETVSADASSGARTPVFWFHGTPNIGAPPVPLFAAAAEQGLRWVSYDRPGYGGSSPNPGRTIASAASDVAAVADALGIGRFAVLGHSGGGPHALACAAVLGDRVAAAVSVSGLAPFADGQEDTWYAGMYPGGEAALRAARTGREEREAHVAKDEYDPEMFTSADHAALEGDWKWILSVVGPALDNGLGAMIDDDVAYAHPWGCDPAAIAVPTLLLHGTEDRMNPCSHSESLARQIPNATLRISRGDGHISILRHAAEAVAWLGSQTRSE
ncbi:MAG TPA: alpha/beta hydrolase [Trebonia sp.]